MANLKFARGTTAPTYSTSGFDDGCVYFNTFNQNIYLRNGTASSSSTVEVFKGTDTNNIPGVTSMGASTYCSYANCDIQNMPRYSSEADYDSSHLGTTSWYSWIGQNVVTAYDLIDNSYAESFDTAISNYKSLPPLETAKEIIVAIDTYNLSRAANNGTTPTNGINVFSYYPEDCIVHCFRTTSPGHPANGTNNYTYDSSGAMFTGYTTMVGNHVASSTSFGTETNITRVKVQLCLNGTNAISVTMKGFLVAGGTETFSSVSVNADSAKCLTADTGTYYANVEKHVYPLAIRYI